MGQESSAVHSRAVQTVHVGRNNPPYRLGALLAGKQLCRRVAGDLCEDQVDCKPATSPRSKGSQATPWAALGGLLPAVQGGGAFSAHESQGAHWWMAVPGAGLPSA